MLKVMSTLLPKGRLLFAATAAAEPGAGPTAWEEGAFSEAAPLQEPSEAYSSQLRQCCRQSLFSTALAAA